MERLKAAVPAELRRAVGEGTAGDLPSTTSRLLAFLNCLPLFHQVSRRSIGILVLPLSWMDVARSAVSVVCFFACFWLQGHRRADRPGARAVPQGQGESGRVEGPGQRVLLQEGV